MGGRPPSGAKRVKLRVKRSAAVSAKEVFEGFLRGRDSWNIGQLTGQPCILPFWGKPGGSSSVLGSHRS